MVFIRCVRSYIFSLVYFLSELVDDPLRIRKNENCIFFMATLSKDGLLWFVCFWRHGPVSLDISLVFKMKQIHLLQRRGSKPENRKSHSTEQMNFQLSPLNFKGFSHPNSTGAQQVVELISANASIDEQRITHTRITHTVYTMAATGCFASDVTAFLYAKSLDWAFLHLQTLQSDWKRFQQRSGT